MTTFRYLTKEKRANYFDWLFGLLFGDTYEERMNGSYSTFEERTRLIEEALYHLSCFDGDETVDWIDFEGNTQRILSDTITAAFELPVGQ